MKRRRRELHLHVIIITKKTASYLGVTVGPGEKPVNSEEGYENGLREAFGQSNRDRYDTSASKKIRLIMKRRSTPIIDFSWSMREGLEDNESTYIMHKYENNKDKHVWGARPS